MTALIALGLLVGLAVPFAIMIASPKQPRLLRMTPAEERAAETGSSTITSTNIDEIINFTIEEGYDHPALAARKANN